MTGETVWVPHYRTKGEKPCEGCSHLESGPDWVHGSKRIERVSK